MAHLWLVLVLVAVVRWSEDLFVIFITFRTFGTAVDDLIDRWSSSQKKKLDDSCCFFFKYGQIMINDLSSMVGSSSQLCSCLLSEYT